MSPPSMTSINEEAASLYSNIMQEIQQRLLIIQRALKISPADLADTIALSDLCALQFRKVSEGIALGCLAVHGDDFPETSKTKSDAYRADQILKRLAQLHPEFYPVPCRLVRVEGTPGEHIQKAVSGRWLTKERLQKVYHIFDHEMHVGTLTRRTLTASTLAHESLADTLLITQCLLRCHYIQLRDPNARIVAEFFDDRVPEITVRVRVPDANP